MKKKTLIIILTIIVVCGAIITAAAVNADKIMMRFSPEMYISYRALNTIKQIENEQEMIDGALPELRDLSDDHNLSAKINLNDKAIAFTEDYNEDAPSMIFNGSYDGIDFDGYINNTETGLCFPSLLDIYFTFSTENFGAEFVQGGGNKLLPIGITEGLNLTLPSDKDSDPDIIKDSQMLSIAKTVISDAEINHDTGDDYFLILKTENVKSALKSFAEILKNNPALTGKFSRIESIAGITFSELVDALTASIDSMSLGDTIAIGYTERRNHVSRIEAMLTDGNTNVTLLWKAENEIRLLEDYTVSLMTEADGSKVGIEYHENGSRFFQHEEKQNNKSLKIIFGNEELFKLALNLNYDRSGRVLTGTASANEFTADLNGTIDNENMMIKIENIMSGEENIGSAELSLTDSQNLQITKREKYPFKDLQLEDLSELLELKGAN